MMINSALLFLLLASPASAGAICKDGWVSDSSGSGTCSHHGGVATWGSAETYTQTYSFPEIPSSGSSGEEIQDAKTRFLGDDGESLILLFGEELYEGHDKTCVVEATQVRSKSVRIVSFDSPTPKCWESVYGARLIGDKLFKGWRTWEVSGLVLVRAPELPAAPSLPPPEPLPAEPVPSKAPPSPRVSGRPTGLARMAMTCPIYTEPDTQADVIGKAPWEGLYNYYLVEGAWVQVNSGRYSGWVEKGCFRNKI